MEKVIAKIWENTPAGIKQLFKVLPYLLASGALSSLIAYLQGIQLEQGLTQLIIAGIINLLLVLLREIQKEVSTTK